MKHLKKAARRVATPPQSEPLDERQVPNSAGGYAYPVNDWTRLDRFLILGSEGGSYYADEEKLSLDNAKCIARLVKSDGPRVVARVVEISESGRAPKNDPALLALAFCLVKGDDKTKRGAVDAVPRVARIGTHLFHLCAFTQEIKRGWRRSLRRAVGNWYLGQTAEKLASQVTKYQQRDGWSHRDLLRLTHPKSEELNPVFRFAVKGEVDKNAPRVIQGHALIQKAESKQEVVKLIRGYKLVRESVPTQFLTEAEVWAALLENKMPMTAMIRNLGNMSKVGLLVHGSEAEKIVCAALRDEEVIRKARVHPIQVLIALKTYEAGHGIRGKGEWTACRRVVDALDDAYYAAFENVKSTGKRWYLGMDISGSMWGGVVAGVPGLTPAIASGALAMVTVRAEEDYYAAGFTCNSSGRYGGRWDSGSTAMTPMTFSRKQRLDDVLKVMHKLEQRMGGTDCALPMLDALKKKLKIDVFAIYTDSETWAGDIHPTQALGQYRQKTGIPAKLIVVGMVANEFSIADPNDAGMLDVVGFDTATPRLIADFGRDEVESATSTTDED